MNTQIENGNSEITEVEEVAALDDNETDPAVIRQHSKDVEARNQQLYIRLKKEQGFVKGDDGKWVKPPKTDAVITPAPTTQHSTEKLSQTDLITLVKSDIDEGDISEVVEYASFKKISIADALKSGTVKAMLADKAEARKVAAGTNTATARRSSSSNISDESLIQNAQEGKMPDSDEGLARLIEAQHTRMKK